MHMCKLFRVRPFVRMCLLLCSNFIVIKFPGQSSRIQLEAHTFSKQPPVQLKTIVNITPNSNVIKPIKAPSTRKLFLINVKSIKYTHKLKYTHKFFDFRKAQRNPVPFDRDRGEKRHRNIVRARLRAQPHGLVQLINSIKFEFN